MTGTQGDVIRVAKSQVGYHEGYSGGHWNNKQKYSPAVPTLEWSQNQAWCATFCAWVFQEAGMPKGSYPVTASVAVARDWWKQRDRFSEYPAIGAQCIMGASGTAHTGIVYAYDATYIYTVEGNTNSSGSAEGDGVYLKKRARRDSYIYGYGYPNYPGGIVTADPTWKNLATRPEEDDVALSADDIKKVAAEVEKQLTSGPELLAYLVGTDNVLKAGSDEKDPKNTYWALGSFVAGTYNKQVRTETKVDALADKVNALSTGGVDLDALAAKVADSLGDAFAAKVADLLATRLAK